MFDRLIATGGMLCGMTLFAESPAIGNDWSNWTALTAVIATLLFIVMKMLPDLHQKSLDQTKVFADSIEKQATAFAASMTEIQGKYSDTLDRIHDRSTLEAKSQSEEIAKLREHCASRLAQVPLSKQ